MPESYVHRHVVTFDETNLVGNVYFAHYLHWQGHCREHFLAEHAPSVISALREDLALVTVSCSAEFYAEGAALDEIEIRMMLEGVDGHRITMCFDYVRIDPGPVTLLARGMQTVACMRRAAYGLEPVPVLPELRAALGRYTAVPR